MEPRIEDTLMMAAREQLGGLSAADADAFLSNGRNACQNNNHHIC